MVPDAGVGADPPDGGTLSSDGGGDPDGGATADADARPEPLSVHFTRPEPGERDLALEELVLDLLEKTPAGATVRVAYFTFSRTRMAEAFADALDRGVDLRLILGNTNRKDDGTDFAAVEILRERLGRRLTICRDGESSGGCIGDGIQHNKFITFSELDDGSENVVLQSSANLTNPQLEQFNNSAVIRGDETLYSAYIDYWYDLHREQLDLDYYHSIVGDLGTKVYFFPRESGDLFLGVLDNVHCDVGADITMGQAFFTNPRVAIAEKLAEMDAAGCNIKVLTNEDHLGGDVLEALSQGSIEVSVFFESADTAIHSKYVLIDGAYGANATEQKLVWTGSHNFTGPALRSNDETSLKIRNESMFEAFLADWQHAAGYADSIHP